MQALAAASAGAGHDVRGLPAARAGRARPGALGADPRPVHGRAVPVPGPVDRAVLDRVHLDRAGQRLGRDRQRVVVQHPRRRADPVAGRAADEHHAAAPGSTAPRSATSWCSCCCRSWRVNCCGRGSPTGCPARGADQGVDRGSILLVVYTAFSMGMVEHIWRSVNAWQLVDRRGRQHRAAGGGARLHLAGRRLARLDRGDASCCCSAARRRAWRPAFRWRWCSSAPRRSALIMLPLMIFHQIQLVVCSVIASRLSRDSRTTSLPRL